MNIILNIFIVVLIAYHITNVLTNPKEYLTLQWAKEYHSAISSFWIALEFIIVMIIIVYPPISLTRMIISAGLFIYKYMITFFIIDLKLGEAKIELACGEDFKQIVLPYKWMNSLRINSACFTIFYILFLIFKF